MTSLSLKASFLWRSTGDIQTVEMLLANSAASPDVRATQALFQRRFSLAIGTLSNALAALTPAHHTLTKGGGYLPERERLELLLGLSQQRARNFSAADATYQRAARILRHALKTAGLASNLAVALHAALGEAYAGLGEADAALNEGRKATMMVPASKDALDGPTYEENMARIYAQLGEAGDAIALLKRLLQIPYRLPITTALLRLDPLWDPIRNDPRFQELIAEQKP